MKSYEIAKKYLGLQERKDTKALMELFKKAGIVFDPVKEPWCAVFVNCMEILAGNKGTGRANARSFTTYGTAVTDNECAKEGDIVIFKRGNSAWQGHVGFFVERNGLFIKVLGGNQKDSVCEQWYPVSSLLGIRRPPN